MDFTHAGVTLELHQGDITNQPDIDAVVNAANAELRIGGGVAGAIHKAAGPELEKECREYAPISPGEAVISDAYSLPNKKVIHCLGPVYGKDKPEDELLANCYKKALSIAERESLTSIAFPSISTGAFGYPMEEAAALAFKTLKEELPHYSNIKTVRFVLFSKGDLEVHERMLN